MDLAQLRALAVAHGFPDPDLAAAVAMAESSGDPCALGDPHMPPDCTVPPVGPSTSFGLWQIHVPAHPEYDPGQLFDPDYNATAAFAISSGGINWHPWSAYTHGKYVQFLPSGYPVTTDEPTPQPSDACTRWIVDTDNAQAAAIAESISFHDVPVPWADQGSYDTTIGGIPYRFVMWWETGMKAVAAYHCAGSPSSRTSTNLAGAALGAAIAAATGLAVESVWNAVAHRHAKGRHA